MAYISQEVKKKLTPQIKNVLKKYGMKGSIGIKHYSTLVVNLKSGHIDFGDDPNRNVNEYYINEQYTGKRLEFLSELKSAMDQVNYDRSDLATDYIHVGWYIDINIGKWDKPYVFTSGDKK